MITTTRFLCFVSLKKNPISSSYVSMVLVMMDSFWINLWNSTQPFLFHNITVPSVYLYGQRFLCFFFFSSYMCVCVCVSYAKFIWFCNNFSFFSVFICFLFFVFECVSIDFIIIDHRWTKNTNKIVDHQWKNWIKIKGNLNLNLSNSKKKFIKEVMTMRNRVFHQIYPKL